jgi:serine protease Do
MTQCAAGSSRLIRWTVCACSLAACCCLPAMLSTAAGSQLRMTPIVKAVQEARPSVVNIRGEKTVAATSDAAEPGEMAHRVNGMGTGVVIDHRGYILTNYHVVDGVREIQVTLDDEQRFVAKIVARDPETDLAIIKIDATRDLAVMNIGRSSDLMVGESVIAVGNAYGYEHTVTRGIVSSLHRAVQVSDAQFYADLIQTDASINPGNSGGPLLNIDGEMIGINVAVRAGAQGIGFAIPIDKAMNVANTLLAARNVKFVQHGLVFKPSADAESKGLVVASVDANSPAATAGIRPGDIVAGVEDTDVGRPLDFQRALLDRKPGEKLSLAVRRDAETLKLDMTLAGASKTSNVADRAAWQLLGLELGSMSAEQFRSRYKTQYRGGLLVTSVRPDSPAADQGIRSGDVLVGMHIWETVSMENVSYILGRPDLGNDGPVKFYILRGEETLYGYMAVAMKIKTAQR